MRLNEQMILALLLLIRCLSGVLQMVLQIRSRDTYEGAESCCPLLNRIRHFLNVWRSMEIRSRHPDVLLACLHVQKAPLFAVKANDGFARYGRGKVATEKSIAIMQHGLKAYIPSSPVFFVSAPS